MCCMTRGVRVVAMLIRRANCHDVIPLAAYGPLSRAVIAHLRYVRDAALRADRDPASIEINAMFGRQMADPAAGIEQMQELGVGRAMIPAFFFAGPGGLDRLRAFGSHIAAATSR